jgi:hypothetical protein
VVFTSTRDPEIRRPTLSLQRTPDGAAESCPPSLRERVQIHLKREGKEEMEVARPPVCAPPPLVIQGPVAVS